MNNHLNAAMGGSAERSASTPVVAGIDVSKRHLDACRQTVTGSSSRRFANTPAGHRSLVAWLTPALRGAEAPARPPARPPAEASPAEASSVRVVIEATGRYGLDLALALHQADRVQVMVANPKAVRHHAKAQLRRTKTDGMDAAILADYAGRMSFTPWTPPSREVRQLRAIARRIQALTRDRAREKNRLEAHTAYADACGVVTNDIEVTLRHLARRIDELVRQALKVISGCPDLTARAGHLMSVRGIAEKSAILLLGELAVLPPGMSVREWVAHAGLDPSAHESGTSVRAPERISKIGNARIRGALYMPAHVAVRHEPHVRAFYEKLLARGKPKMVAIVAVMRKLLHAIYGMLKHGQDFDGRKFYDPPNLAPAT